MEYKHWHDEMSDHVFCHYVKENGETIALCSCENDAQQIIEALQNQETIVYHVHWRRYKAVMIGPKGFDFQTEWHKLDAFVSDKPATKFKRFSDHLRYKCGFRYIETETVMLS